MMTWKGFCNFEIVALSAVLCLWYGRKRVGRRRASLNSFMVVEENRRRNVSVCKPPTVNWKFGVEAQCLKCVWFRRPFRKGYSIRKTPTIDQKVNHDIFPKQVQWRSQMHRTWIQDLTPLLCSIHIVPAKWLEQPRQRASKKIQR